MERKDQERRVWLEEQNMKRKAESEAKRHDKELKIAEVKRREEQILAKQREQFQWKE